MLLLRTFYNRNTPGQCCFVAVQNSVGQFFGSRYLFPIVFDFGNTLLVRIFLNAQGYLLMGTLTLVWSQEKVRYN